MKKNAVTAAMVNEALAEIKGHMPGVYASIQAKAAADGAAAFALVRRGVRGEANCFYAFERGRVVGTPFALEHPINDVVARAMVEFGCGFCVVWAQAPKE